MFDKLTKLICAAGGAALLTVSLPEMLYYAAPIMVIGYTGGVILLLIAIKSAIWD